MEEIIRENPPIMNEGGMIYIYEGKDYTPSELIRKANAKTIREAIQALGMENVGIKGLGKTKEFKIRAFSLGGSSSNNLYHGSPKRFKTFSIKNIGKGDGHSIGGWGLYLTDDKDVAKSYTLKGGALYEVSVEKGEWLELDEPIPYELGEKIKKALEGKISAADIQQLQSDFLGGEYDVATGKQLYDWLSSVLGDDKSASLFLNKLGIIGNKFYDKKNPDSTNYVVFDDSAITIVDTEKLKDGGSATEGNLTFREFNDAYGRFYAAEHKWSSYPRGHVIGSIYDEYIKHPEKYKWLDKYITPETMNTGNITFKKPNIKMPEALYQELAESIVKVIDANGREKVEQAYKENPRRTMWDVYHEVSFQKNNTDTHPAFKKYPSRRVIDYSETFREQMGELYDTHIESALKSIFKQIFEKEQMKDGGSSGETYEVVYQVFPKKVLTTQWDTVLFEEKASSTDPSIAKQNAIEFAKKKSKEHEDGLVVYMDKWLHVASADNGEVVFERSGKFNDGGLMKATGTIAIGKMNTTNGEIVGKVVYNDFWKKYQVVIDGATYEEFKTPEEAIDNLERAGFKNVEKLDSGGTTSQALKNMIEKIKAKYDMVAQPLFSDKTRLQIVSPYFNTLSDINRIEFKRQGVLEKYGNTSSYVLYTPAVFDDGGQTNGNDESSLSCICSFSGYLEKESPELYEKMLNGEITPEVKEEFNGAMKMYNGGEAYYNGSKIKDKARYRIQNSDGTFLNAGTGFNSWFTLEDARKIVDRDKGQRIIESDGVNILWEVFNDGGKAKRDGGTITGGKWQVRKEGDKVFIVGERYVAEVLTFHSKTPVAKQYEDIEKELKEEAEANAMLIASAPEMYRALNIVETTLAQVVKDDPKNLSAKLDLQRIRKILSDTKVKYELRNGGQFFEITAGGLQPIRSTINILPNRVYYMGASSSPEQIVVTNVTDEWITYRHYPFYKDLKIEYPIGMSLISSGSKTWLKNYANVDYGWVKERRKSLEDLFAGGRGIETDPNDLKRVKVTIAVKDMEGKDAWSEFEKMYAHSVSSMSNDGKNLTLYESFGEAKRMLDELKKNKHFSVHKIEEEIEVGKDGEVLYEEGVKKISDDTFKLRKIDKKKEGGTIDKDTAILPYVVADTVSDLVIYEKYKSDIANWDNLDRAQKDQLNKDTATDKEKLIDYLVERAETTYAANPSFKKQIKSKKGLDTLYMFMYHWAGVSDGKIVASFEEIIKSYERAKKHHKETVTQ